MAYNKGLHSSSGGSHRGRPYVLILLIIFGAALLGVMVLHKLRERRIYTLIVKDKDHQLLALKLLLQKERDRTKELRTKNEEMKGKIYALRSQKTELARTVVEMQSTLDSLKDEQRVMESAFEENQNELKMVQEKGTNVGQGSSEIIALRESLKHKEAEIKELKHRLEISVKDHPVPINDHDTNFPEIVAANGTMAAQDKNESGNKEKDEKATRSAKYEGDDAKDAGAKVKDFDDASKTKFRDGEVATEIKDETQTGKEQGKTNEDPQDDAAGVTVRDIDAEVVDGREKKAVREEEPGQVQNKRDGVGLDFNLKKLDGVKRKNGHASRKRGEQWRTHVKNTLRENNEIVESHGEVSMENRKVYKDELKDTRVGKVSDEGKGIEDKSHAKLLEPDNHENKDANDMAVSYTNHQVRNSGTDIYPEKERLDEIRKSEEHEDKLQKNWNRRRINKAVKNVEHAKPNILEVPDDNDEEDNEDDFIKKSQPEFDEKEQYKDEIDESEFRPGL
ncbi:hypothetical protein RJT34_31213 [Clitoria ternatea]|uniref:Uncharacterized protein n=1 Tax=Clitoria ternatea TaxID=43366 RepID=A0AAN9I4S7_CLITE